jgi:phosphatidylethanolamine/phosphatidyl-N-methylethanolamine N-methyltransferase
LAPVYDRLTAPMERGALGRWRRRVWAEVPGSGSGLEIGSGTGVNFLFHPPDARMIATDVSLAMLRKSRPRAEGRSISLVASSVEALPFPDGTFDWAVATLVFCEVTDPVAGLTDVRRILRSGARLVLLEHVRPPGRFGTIAAAITAISSPLLGEHFDRDTQANVERAGFRIRHRESLWRETVVLLIAEAP